MNHKKKKSINWTQSQLKTSVFQKTLRDLPGQRLCVSNAGGRSSILVRIPTYPN